MAGMNGGEFIRILSDGMSDINNLLDFDSVKFNLSEHGMYNLSAYEVISFLNRLRADTDAPDYKSPQSEDDDYLNRCGM